MKYTAIIGVICCLAAPPAPAAESSAGEEALVEAEVRKLFEVTPTATKLESEALHKVTDAAIYEVKVVIDGPDARSTSTLRCAKEGEEVSVLQSPVPGQACPWLKDLIKEDFKLKTEEDAKQLEAALDVFYPISENFGGKDQKAKAIRWEDGRVIFVRGQFFDKPKGFVFGTDEKGAILAVNYSHSLEGDGE